MRSTGKDTLIVMFDDQRERQSKADLLQEHTGHTVRFVDLQDKRVIDEVEKAVGQVPEPSMVLVDHILDKAVAESTIRKGTSVVPLLRETWPSAPIIAITAAYEKCVDNIDSDVYEDVIPIEWFSEFVSYAPAVIAGYDAVGDTSRDLEGLLSLIKVPDSEREALRNSIPSLVKRSSRDTSFPHRVFRWFRRTFYRKPGFLLNRQWTALVIGVSDEYFSQYETDVAGARYDGIFADPNDARWWKATLYSCLLPDSRERFTIGLCEAAKQKLRIPEEHESKCYRCGEKWPEVMGYVDEAATSEKEAKPLHLRCSRAHPLSAPEPFYEERRLMLDDE